MIRRPPRSTLFPSRRSSDLPAFAGTVHALQIIGNTLYIGGSFQNAAGIASADYLVACDLATGNPSDRKSTRLNSSHSQISYAVFCLKKKTKKQHTTNYNQQT